MPSHPENDPIRVAIRGLADAIDDVDGQLTTIRSQAEAFEQERSRLRSALDGLLNHVDDQKHPLAAVGAATKSKQPRGHLRDAVLAELARSGDWTADTTLLRSLSAQDLGPVSPAPLNALRATLNRLARQGDIERRAGASRSLPNVERSEADTSDLSTETPRKEVIHYADATVHNSDNKTVDHNVNDGTAVTHGSCDRGAAV